MTYTELHDLELSVRREGLSQSAARLIEGLKRRIEALENRTYPLRCDHIGNGDAAQFGSARAK